jgi:hypothetical protein
LLGTTTENFFEISHLPGNKSYSLRVESFGGAESRTSATVVVRLLKVEEEVEPGER